MTDISEALQGQLAAHARVDAARAKLNAASPGSQAGRLTDGDVTINTGALDIAGWTDVRISGGLDRMPATFDLGMTETYPGAVAHNQLQAGQGCRIRIGGDTVIVGWINRVIRSLSPNGHTMRVQGPVALPGPGGLLGHAAEHVDQQRVDRRPGAAADRTLRRTDPAAAAGREWGRQGLPVLGFAGPDAVRADRAGGGLRGATGARRRGRRPGDLQGGHHQLRERVPRGREPGSVDGDAIGRGALLPLRPRADGAGQPGADRRRR